MTGEPLHGIVFRTVSDYAARIFDTPEIAGITAYSVEYLKGDAVFVVYVLSFDTFLDELHLITQTDIRTEITVKFFSIPCFT